MKKKIEMPEESKPAYYAILTADVRYHADLPSGAKLLFAEITSLTNKEGFCWAKNEYFAGLYNVTTRSIRGWVNKLIKYGFVTAEIHDGNIRKIYLEGGKFFPGGRKKKTDREENFFHHSINTKYNTKSNSKTKTFFQKVIKKRAGTSQTLKQILDGMNFPGKKEDNG